MKTKTPVKSNQLERACSMIRSDRMGVSSDVEKLVAVEVKKALNEYFCLSGDVDAKIDASESGYVITIVSKATSIKHFGIVS